MIFLAKTKEEVAAFVKEFELKVDASLLYKEQKQTEETLGKLNQLIALAELEGFGCESESHWWKASQK